MGRFDRQRLIPDWRQDRLAAAVVVVAGVGALGNEVARILAQSGVGALILCDPDRVEESNLSRAILFRGADVGRPKVEVAARALEGLAPGIRAVARPSALIHGVGLGELRDASLVVSCLDSRTARLQLAGRCQLVRAPLLDGGTHPWGGEVRPFLDPDGPCYGCTLGPTGRGESDVPWSCLEPPPRRATPAAAPSSALVGTWMAMVAARFLMGLDGPAGFLKIDGVRGLTSLVEPVRDPTCPLHRPIDRAERITLTHRDRIGDLQAALGPGEVPLAWEPVQQSLKCPACGFEEPRWGRPEPGDCPRCGRPALPATTLELDRAPNDLTLERLGVAPGEILAVRGGGGIRWVELVGGAGSGPARVPPG
jgi:hypothetical protein